MKILLLTLAVVLSIAGCASGGGAGTSGTSGVTAYGVIDSNVSFGGGR